MWSKVLVGLLVVLCVVGVASGDTGSIHWVSSSSSTITGSSDASKAPGSLEPIYMYFADADTMRGWQKTVITVPASVTTVSGGDGVSGWDTSVTFRYGSITGPVVGTGIYGYELVGSNYIITVLSWLDFDVTAYSGSMNIYIADSTISVIPKSTNIYDVTGWAGLGADDVIFKYRYYFGSWQVLDFGANGYTVVTDLGYDYYNNYAYNSYVTHNYFEMYRTVYNGTQMNLSINGTWDNETSVKSTDYQKLSTDLDNMTWDFTIENLFGEVKYLEINFDIAPITSVGTIDLNQSSYTEPELVQIDAELITYDFINHNYYVQIKTSEDLDTWTYAAGDYNATTQFSYDNISRTFDIAASYYDLPIWIRAELVDLNTATGATTILDTTPAVLYNPPTSGIIRFGGTVIDGSTDSIISGANVTATGPTTQTVYSDYAGRFVLYLLPGTYSISGSKTGYETNTYTDQLIVSNTSTAKLFLIPTETTEGVIYGTIIDADTADALDDVHVIFTNATDTIHAYTASNGYYEAEGFNNSSTYTIRALKSGYYSYNGSVTTEASGATHKSFEMVQTEYSATPTPTAVSTYPGGEGYAWTNDDIVTMLRVLVPSLFMFMLIFLLIAVMLGITGNNGGSQGGLHMDDLWRR